MLPPPETVLQTLETAPQVKEMVPQPSEMDAQLSEMDAQPLEMDAQPLEMVPQVKEMIAQPLEMVPQSCGSISKNKKPRFFCGFFGLKEFPLFLAPMEAASSGDAQAATEIQRTAGRVFGKCVNLGAPKSAYRHLH